MSLTGLYSKEEAVLLRARQALDKGIDASAFAQMFFSPQGELRGLWNSPEEKAALVQTEPYKWLQQKLAELRGQGTLQFEREIEQMSAKLTVSVPKSLHSALRQEASREGVSVSELVRLKLGYPYQLLVNLFSSSTNKTHS